MNKATRCRRGRDAGNDGEKAKKQQRIECVAHMRPPIGHDGDAAAGRFGHPFCADFNDHFETSIEALRDILIVVNQLRLLLRPSTPEKFVVYDPYYCAGSVVQHWNALGIQRVIHENRDFYKDIAEGTVPREYDMLVTNPPFSGDHIERMFSYLTATRKPFAFLAPDYIATKEWYKTAVRRYFIAAPPTGKGDINSSRRARPQAPAAALQLPPFVRVDATRAKRNMETLHGRGSESSEENEKHGDEGTFLIGIEPFYLVPPHRYDFKHPKGAGNEHSHFRSMWFVWAGQRTMEVLRGAKVEVARMRCGELTERRMVPDVVHGLDALAEGHYVQMGLRPNPQRRAKQRHLRRSK